MRAGNVGLARHDVVAPLDHAREQVGDVLQGLVQDIARARDAAGGAAPMQIGTVKGKGVKGNGQGELMQAEKER